MAWVENTNIGIKADINNKFLQFQTDTSDKYGLLHFATNHISDPNVQFEVVVNTNDTNFVHLKARYNDKYLIRWEPNSNLISASADLPNDDKTSWSCTLYKPILIQQDGETKKVQFQHVQLGHYLTLGAAPYANYLCAHPTKRDTFTVIDWDSVLRFNKARKVALRGDDNNYMGVTHMVNGRPNLQFSFKDPKDPKAALEIIPTATDGLITIKSTYLGKFWRLDKDDQDKIVIDVKDPSTTNNSLPFFRFTMLDINRIALISASKGWFCQRHHAPPNYPNSYGSINQNLNQYTSLVIVDLE